MSTEQLEREVTEAWIRHETRNHLADHAYPTYAAYRDLADKLEQATGIVVICGRLTGRPRV